MSKICCLAYMFFNNVLYIVWQIETKVKVKVTQSCPTRCDPLDYTVHGILQARILEWVG